MADITQISNPEAVINFFTTSVGAYAIITGLSEISYAYAKDKAGMKYLRYWLLIFSLLFFLLLTIILFVSPTPFESILWYARILFLGAIAMTILIIWQTLK